MWPLVIICFLVSASSALFGEAQGKIHHTTSQPTRAKSKTEPPKKNISVEMIQVEAGKFVGKNGEQVIVTAETAKKINDSSAVTKALIENFWNREKHQGLDSYLHIRNFRVAPYATPYSDFKNGVITVNNFYSEPPGKLLLLTLHEQIHAYLSASTERDTKLNKALEDLRRADIFKGLPLPSWLENAPDKGRYEMEAHMVVNYLELQAARRFLGRERGEALFRQGDVYQELNRRLFENEPLVARIVRANGLEIE